MKGAARAAAPETKATTVSGSQGHDALYRRCRSGSSTRGLGHPSCHGCGEPGSCIGARRSDRSTCMVFTDRFQKRRLDNWFRVVGDWTVEDGQVQMAAQSRAEMCRLLPIAVSASRLSHGRGRLREAERHRFEACTASASSRSCLELLQRRPVALAAGISCKRPAASDEEARPRHRLGIGELLESARVALDTAPVFSL